jgi:hypothetical protein
VATNAFTAVAIDPDGYNIYAAAYFPGIVQISLNGEIGSNAQITSYLTLGGIPFAQTLSSLAVTEHAFLATGAGGNDWNSGLPLTYIGFGTNTVFQMVNGGNLTALSTLGSLNETWNSLAISQQTSGTPTAVVAAYGGQIFTAQVTNSAINVWQTHNVTGYWKSVAISGDGTRIVAVQDGGQVYLSTDSGARRGTTFSDLNFNP